MHYVGLCVAYSGGNELYVTDDIDCMSPGLLGFPGLERKRTESPFTAAREYVEEWDLVDEQTPPLPVTISTTHMSWDGLAIANNGKVKLVDAEEE